MSVRSNTSNGNFSKFFPFIVVLGSGLYPFSHYYSNNLSIADSFFQFSLLAFFCFGIPLIVVLVCKLLVKFKFFSFFKEAYLSIINFITFSILLSYLIFHFGKGRMIFLVLMSLIFGFFLHKYLKKIIILQLLVAGISLVSFAPKLWFALNANNDWSKVPEEMLRAPLQKYPNIFVIQPDGYSNSETLKKPPYNYDNSEFEGWLENKNFKIYEGYKSNYYSTLTSNSSMFAMKHHYYCNTDPKTIKTFNATDVIVGSDNNVLKLLKHNLYSSYLFTDNSYFLSNRRKLFFDKMNISRSSIPLFNASNIEGVNIQSDLTQHLDSLSTDRNFIFIEKTVPGHVSHSKIWSVGKEQERVEYLTRLQEANDWLKGIVEVILEYDDNALIIIVADHGGYVGLEYTGVAIQRALNEEEAISSFSAFLSVKWPKEVNDDRINIRTSVNLFSQIFYSLSNNPLFVDSLQNDASYLPLKTDGKAFFYKVIDEEDNVNTAPLSDN